jgi:hypothetical protein
LKQGQTNSASTRQSPSTPLVTCDNTRGAYVCAVHCGAAGEGRARVDGGCPCMHARACLPHGRPHERQRLRRVIRLRPGLGHACRWRCWGGRKPQSGRVLFYSLVLLRCRVAALRWSGTRWIPRPVEYSVLLEHANRPHSGKTCKSDGDDTTPPPLTLRLPVPSPTIGLLRSHFSFVCHPQLLFPPLIAGFCIW